jgi:2-phosphosulfolactate phosphatase
MMSDKPTVEVCFSPKLYEHKLTKGNFITVVVDILRATTSICAAFDHGVKQIIPVSGLDEARRMKAQGFIIACERDGQVMDFADIGNSASEFIREDLIGETVVFSTTNGTKTINMARDAQEVLVGAFVNYATLTDYLIRQQQNVVVFCAAWKNLFNLEDSVFGGAVAQKLLDNGFITFCDAALGAIDMWEKARPDLKAYLARSSHRNRLRHLVSEEDFDYTVTLNSTSVVPRLKGDRLELL